MGTLVVEGMRVGIGCVLSSREADLFVAFIYNVLHLLPFSLLSLDHENQYSTVGTSYINATRINIQRLEQVTLMLRESIFNAWNKLH